MKNDNKNTKRKQKKRKIGDCWSAPYDRLKQFGLQTPTKDCQRRGRRHQLWKAVPHLSSCNRKDTITICWVDSTGNNQRHSRCKSQPLSWLNCRHTFEFISKVWWRKSVLTTVHQHREFKRDTFSEPAFGGVRGVRLNRAADFKGPHFKCQNCLLPRTKYFNFTDFRSTRRISWLSRGRLSNHFL